VCPKPADLVPQLVDLCLCGHGSVALVLGDPEGAMLGVDGLGHPVALLLHRVDRQGLGFPGCLQLPSQRLHLCTQLVDALVVPGRSGVDAPFLRRVDRRAAPPYRSSRCPPE
jgi:hypothetical protein